MQWSTFPVACPCRPLLSHSTASTMPVINRPCPCKPCSTTRYMLCGTLMYAVSPCEHPYELPHNTFLCGLANPQQHTTPSASNPLKDWQHSSRCFNKTAPNNTSTCHPMPFSNHYAASTWYTYKLQLVSCTGVDQRLP